MVQSAHKDLGRLRRLVAKCHAVTRPPAVQAVAGFAALILAAYGFQETVLIVFVLPAVLTVLGIRAAIAASVVVIGAAIGEYWFTERMFSAVSGQWLFPFYYSGPFSRIVVVGFAAALCAAWFGSYLGARLAGENAVKKMVRRWRSASAIVGGSVAALLLFVYVVTHLRPDDAEIKAEYERLAALTHQELQAIALTSDVSVEERRDAVAMLGNMGTPDAHIDKRLELLLATQSAPGIAERVASEAEHLAGMLGMFRHLGGPSPDWVWREEDYRKMNFHESYRHHRGRLP
jgi:alkanesulfonate monooxygenase SsuD/methylene tetrahydromethanopterin reductase-like flavin-dependent oxidoreductase (luciferase family)